MHGHANERQEPWLLIKERDEEARPAAEYSVVDAEPASVLSGRTIEGRPTKAAAKATTKPATAPAPAAKKAATKAVQAAKAKPSRSAKAPPRLPLPRRPLRRTPPPARPPARRRRRCPTRCRRSSRRWCPSRRRAAAGSGRSSSTATGSSPASTATTCACSPAAANDWSARLPALVDAVRGLGLGQAWLDGEIVVHGANGAPDFNALQNAFDSSRTASIAYYVFDLPYCAGHDLREVPSVERRAVLAGLLERAPASENVRLSQSFDASAEELLQNACRMRLEGMIGKRADSPYVSRRSPTWIKLKCTHRQEFVVGGWTDPKGSRTGIGSLLLGIHDERGHLRFAGGVGSGFDQTSLAALRKALDGLATETTPFFEKPRDVRGHWVEPKLVAEVSFGEWTPDGRIRHSVFHGLRDDKSPRSVTREQPVEAEAVTKATAKTAAAGAKKAAASPATAKKATTAAKKAPAAAKTTKKAAAGDAEVEGIRISHPDRVIDASTGLTKLDVVNHYLAVSKLILPHLAGRPVSLVRAPAGIAGQLFFQKHADTVKIPDLRQLDPAISPDHKPMVEIDSFTALIGAAQANVIELHTWNATTTRQRRGPTGSSSTSTPARA
jgi:bifunctional non-homologous end joining protein LigD